MSSFVITLVLLLTVNLIVSTLVQAMVPNYYLASMITSVIIAFLYGILATDEDRLHFFKQRDFYVRFLGSAIIFLLVDCVMFLL
jgi:hypothetical protein